MGSWCDFEKIQNLLAYLHTFYKECAKSVLNRKPTRISGNAQSSPEKLFLEAEDYAYLTVVLLVLKMVIVYYANVH